MKKSLVLMFLIIFLIGFVSAVGHYVSPTGSASWSQCVNIATPCSLATANANATAGDTIYLKGGNYTTGIKPMGSGTSNENRIIYTINEKDVVIIKDIREPMILDNRDYITVTGTPQQKMIFTNTDDILNMDDGDYNIFSYLKIGPQRNYYGWQIMDIGTNSSYNWIHHCEIFKYGKLTENDDLGHLLNIGGESGVGDSCCNLVENNLLYSSGHNVFVIHSKYNVFRDNYAYSDAWFEFQGRMLGGRVGALKDKSGNNGWNLMEGNRVAYSAWNMEGQYLSQSVLQMDNHDGIFRKNMFYAGLGGLNIYTGDGECWGKPGCTDNNYFYNNVMFYFNRTETYATNESRRHAAILWNHGNWSYSYVLNHTVFKNNIFNNNVDSSSKPNKNDVVEYQKYQGPEDKVINTILEANWGEANGSPKFVGADPLKTTDPTNANYPNFNLQSSSPCIDNGTHLTKTYGSGSNSKSLKVIDAHYFFSGDGAPWNIPTYTGIRGDYVFVDNPTASDFIVEVDSIDYKNNILNLVSSQTWEKDAEVYLAVSPTMGFYGKAPDIGAFEYVSGENPPQIEICNNDIDDDGDGKTDCDDSECFSDSNCQKPIREFYKILKTNKTMTVDGDISEFNGANEIALTSASTGTIGRYRLMWNENALYISANVSDDDLSSVVATRDGSGIWNDDSIELMFDVGNNKSNSMNLDDYKFFVNINNTQLDYRGVEGNGWNISFNSAVKNSGSGYSIEIAIPWNNWNISVPVEDKTIVGFELNMNDRVSDGTRYYAVWNNSDGGSINNPSGWGEVLFSSETPISPKCTILLSHINQKMIDWRDRKCVLGDVIVLIRQWVAKGRC